MKNLNRLLLISSVVAGFLSVSPIAMGNGHFYYNEPSNNDPYHDSYYDSSQYHRPARKVSSYDGGGAGGGGGAGKSVRINLSTHTWAAYQDGRLVKSGRVSGGKNYCPDLHRGCRTPTGTYTVYSKQGSGCISTKFPVGKGGAKMPYCMFFKGGYAMHGSNAVPNYNASHGCVRMPVEDARWLNQEFVNVGSTRVRITN